MLSAVQIRPATKKEMMRKKERKRELNLRVWSITNCLGYKTQRRACLGRDPVWSITNCLGYKTAVNIKKNRCRVWSITNCLGYKTILLLQVNLCRVWSITNLPGGPSGIFC